MLKFDLFKPFDLLRLQNRGHFFKRFAGKGVNNLPELLSSRWSRKFPALFHVRSMFHRDGTDAFLCLDYLFIAEFDLLLHAVVEQEKIVAVEGSAQRDTSKWRRNRRAVD